MTDSYIGRTLYIAKAVPATNDKAGFEALSWVQVKGIQSLPVFGVTHEGIDVPDLATGFTASVKGAGSGRDTTFSFRTVASDTGQSDAITTADDAHGLCSLKIGVGSGTDSGDGPALETGDPVKYAQGYVHSYEENEGTDSTHEGGTIGFRQNNFTVTDAEPA